MEREIAHSSGSYLLFPTVRKDLKKNRNILISRAIIFFLHSFSPFCPIDPMLFPLFPHMKIQFRACLKQSLSGFTIYTHSFFRCTFFYFAYICSSISQHKVFQRFARNAETLLEISKYIKGACFCLRRKTTYYKRSQEVSHIVSYKYLGTHFQAPGVIDKGCNIAFCFEPQHKFTSTAWFSGLLHVFPGTPGHAMKMSKEELHLVRDAGDSLSSIHHTGILMTWFY